METTQSTRPKILVIVGTVRENRVGRTVADWYLKQARAATPELDFELFDVAAQKLPVFSEPIPPLAHQYGPLQKKLAEKVGAADGFIFVTGEYNHSIPGSLKNFIDYLNAEWNHKAAAYVGYGGTGAIRSIEHLVQVMAELRVVSVANTSDHIHINQLWNAFDASGAPKPGFVHGDIAKQLKELAWWTKSLKEARQPQPVYA